MKVSRMRTKINRTISILKKETVIKRVLRDIILTCDIWRSHTKGKSSSWFSTLQTLQTVTQAPSEALYQTELQESVLPSYSSNLVLEQSARSYGKHCSMVVVWLPRFFFPRFHFRKIFTQPETSELFLKRRSVLRY